MMVMMMMMMMMDDHDNDDDDDDDDYDDGVDDDGRCLDSKSVYVDVCLWQALHNEIPGVSTSATHQKNIFEKSSRMWHDVVVMFKKSSM